MPLSQAGNDIGRARHRHRNFHDRYAAADYRLGREETASSAVHVTLDRRDTIPILSVSGGKLLLLS